MTTITKRLRELTSLQYWRNKPPRVAVVRLSGVIADRTGLKSGLSLSSLDPVLKRAFETSKIKAVALTINSPGGSPVQSALIAKRIRALAEEHDVAVFAFCEDVAASGGYWLAACADEIYADANSIIGSIGVVSGGFGFTGLIDKIGVERRLHTSGDSKAMLDPFSPEKATDVKHLKSLQSEIHENFKAMVRERRGDRLKGTEKKLFSGAFWTGTASLELGLVDGLGDLHTILREKYGDKVKLKPVKVSKSWLQSWFSSETLSGEAIATVEDKLIWNRFGL
jgi:signal peptide peptidase SppA